MSKCRLPETWNDDVTLEQDMIIRLQAHRIELSEEAMQAFRIGWKAGAMQATMNMGNWMFSEVLGHGKPESEDYDRSKNNVPETEGSHTHGGRDRSS